MQAGRFDDVTHQYRVPDPLQVRVHTHLTYQERPLDLDSEAATLLQVNPATSVLDAGCGPGVFLRYLRDTGHTGRLAGLDQSAGMLRAMRDSDTHVEAVVGDVATLPFADGEFDSTVARHMLYHVPEIPTALAELQRIARRRMLLSTGSQNSMPYLMGLLSDVVTEFGMQRQIPVMGRFCTENAGQWLTQAGLEFEATLLDNALVFNDPEPIVAYVVSCLPSYSIDTQSDLHAEMQAWLHERAASDLQIAGGAIKDPTRVGFYVVNLE